MEITENTKRFIGILAKIPMFQRLQPVQALEILKICKPTSFDDRETLVEHGSKSTEMYILLSGTLVGVEMGLARAGVAYERGGVQAAIDYLAANYRG